MTPARQCPPWVEEWVGWLRAIEGRASSTVEKYRATVVNALAALEIDDPGELRFEDLERHLKLRYAQGYSTSTLAGIVAAMRSFCSYLVAHGVVERSPTAGMKRPRVYRALPSVLTRDEVKALVFGRKGALPYTPAEYRNRVMWYVAYIAGLRASEVGRLELHQLRWEHEESVFSLVISWSKAAEGDVVMPLDDTASRLLGEYLRIRPAIFAPRAESPYLFPTALGGPIGRLRVYKLFAARVRAAGIEPGKRRLTPHVLRHSIATHLLRSGCDVREVQDHLRHASIETTAFYLHTDVSRRARRLRRYRPLEEKRAPQVHVGRAMAALVADLPNL